MFYVNLIFHLKGTYRFHSINFSRDFWWFETSWNFIAFATRELSMFGDKIIDSFPYFDFSASCVAEFASSSSLFSLSRKFFELEHKTFSLKFRKTFLNVFVTTSSIPWASVIHYRAPAEISQIKKRVTSIMRGFYIHSWNNYSVTRI